MKQIGTIWDLVGVGLGPSNLSLSALINGSTHSIKLKAVFFDKQDSFQWHSGMMLQGASMQTSFMKDLVTLVDPSNRYSFLMYLQRIGALYQFLNTDRSKLTRYEFYRYCNWVAEQLPWCNFGEEILGVSHTVDGFAIDTSRRTLLAKNIVVGSGQAPNIPEMFKECVSDRLFHSSVYSFRRSNLKASTSVCVIGGGQSGAEILLDLLKMDTPPKYIHWLSRRSIFSPLDESPFVNELFSPGYVNYFVNVSDNHRARLLSEQKLASDGISPETLNEIYRLIYLNSLMQGNSSVINLVPSSFLEGVTSVNDKVRLEYRYSTGESAALTSDYVVLATGYKPSTYDFLKPMNRLLLRGESGYLIDKDYSIKMNRGIRGRVYLQNGAKHTHGISDPNLSLLAWRSANIINSIAGRSIFEIGTAESFISWDGLGGQHLEKANAY